MKKYLVQITVSEIANGVQTKQYLHERELPMLDTEKFAIKVANKLVEIAEILLETRQ